MFLIGNYPTPLFEVIPLLNIFGVYVSGFGRWTTELTVVQAKFELLLILYALGYRNWFRDHREIRFVIMGIRGWVRGSP